MNKKEFWQKMDTAIENPNAMMATMEMAVLLKQAYIGSQTERFLICYTSKEQAKKETRGGDWNELFTKDLSVRRKTKNIETHKKQPQ